MTLRESKSRRKLLSYCVLWKRWFKRHFLTNIRTGVADSLLAQREEERGRKRELEEIDSPGDREQASKRTRSISPSSASSVSTISTNRSGSTSPRRDNHGGNNPPKLENHPQPWSRKRRHSDSSSTYSVSSHSSRDGSRTRSPERNTRRRRRESSPRERGRPREISLNRSRRDRSRSDSLDKGRVARGQRSTTGEEDAHNRSYAKRPSLKNHPSALYHERGENEMDRGPPPRERSLSPYSKRIALTQAMNMGR